MALGNAVNSSAGLQYLASSGIFSTITDGTSSQVLQGGSPPSFTGYPQISGLGLGASPGSTAGLTFDGTNFINNYAVSTFTPTLVGQTTAGTTTYTNQVGYYVRIGGVVFMTGNVAGSAATGTGNVEIGGFPFTVKNNTGGSWYGALEIVVAQTYPTSRTQASFISVTNTTYANIACTGSGQTESNLAMSNVAFSYNFSTYIEI